MNGACNSTFFFFFFFCGGKGGGGSWGTEEGSKGQISLNFEAKKLISMILYQTLRVFTQIIIYIEQDFYSVI